jgi:hypothetical protein
MRGAPTAPLLPPAALALALIAWRSPVMRSAFGRAGLVALSNQDGSVLLTKRLLPGEGILGAPDAPLPERGPEESLPPLPQSLAVRGLHLLPAGAGPGELLVLGESPHGWDACTVNRHRIARVPLPPGCGPIAHTPNAGWRQLQRARMQPVALPPLQPDATSLAALAAPPSLETATALETGAGPAQARDKVPQTRAQVLAQYRGASGWLEATPPLPWPLP